MELKTGQGTEQLYLGRVAVKSGAVVADEARIEADSRIHGLRHSYRQAKEESSNDFPKQREPRLSHLHCPSV
jgi:hypothetical protein